MRQHEVGEGEVIWRKGDEVLDVVLVGDARLAYRELADVRGATREDGEHRSGRSPHISPRISPYLAARSLEAEDGLLYSN